MDPDKKGFIAPWELRVSDLRVYYADKPEATVVIVAVGIKVREQVRIGGKDFEP